MIFAGPCLFCDLDESNEIMDTALALKDIGVNNFRCKLNGGGTSRERYFKGVGEFGYEIFNSILKLEMSLWTEIKLPSEADFCWQNFFNGWIGARDANNYRLLDYVKSLQGFIWALKRGPVMPIDELFGIHDLYKPTWVIERGIVTFDPMERSRFAPDLKGVIRIKNERPDIFDKLVVDCSHSVFRKAYIEDVYKAFKAIGVQHYMFECTYSGKSKTDQEHMLSVKELEKIIHVN